MVGKKGSLTLVVEKQRALIAMAVLVVMLCFVFSSTGVYAGNRSGVKDNLMVIGLLSDLSGPAAKYGKFNAYAVQDQAKYVNDKGGINGRKIKLFVQDHAYNPVRAIAAAKYLVNKHDVFAFGTFFTSAPCVACFPLIMEEKIPTITQNATPLVYEPFKRYLFANIASSYDQAVMQMEYVVKDLKAKDKKIGIIYQEDDYGKEGARGFKKAAKAYGVRIVAEESYKRGSIDFSSQIVNLRRADPEYVLHCGIMIPSISILKEARKQSWHPQFIMDEQASPIGVLSMASEAGEGLIVTSQWVRSYEDATGLLEMKRSIKKYRPNMTKIEPHYIWSWVNTIILFEGIKRAGRDLTREGLVDAIESLKEFSTGDLCPPVDFGPNDHNGGGAARFLKADLKKGDYVPITGWRKPGIE